MFFMKPSIMRMNGLLQSDWSLLPKMEFLSVKKNPKIFRPLN